MIRALADRLAGNPACFHYLRKLPELNYRATKSRVREVRRRLGRPRVLDVGCGTGEFARLFEAARYVGVDIEPGYVRYASRRNPGYRFECSDVLAWPGDGEPFDLAMVNGVLHHLDDATARSVLVAAATQLRLGGTLLVIEDVQLGDPGFLTRLVHALDQGRFIRGHEDWTRLVSSVLPIQETQCFRSGLCPYQMMVCRKT